LLDRRCGSVTHSLSFDLQPKRPDFTRPFTMTSELQPQRKAIAKLWCGNYNVCCSLSRWLNSVSSAIISFSDLAYH
jgi:hypothetical protein